MMPQNLVISKPVRILLIQIGNLQKNSHLNHVGRLPLIVSPEMPPDAARPGLGCTLVLLFKSPAPISAPRPLSLSTHCFPTRLQSFDLALT